ncbi:hypothetical protein TIFTF001_021561 [Ficus carica]|uniref:MADS-box domain-containing protein n=1 Tax=Ficus carica TaxID=3494 RepID=A0AA88DC03_FICCA|nr:hypothetical protein TIFTF001_021561 [Ficus carica]
MENLPNNNENNLIRRVNRGRQRVEMVRMTNESNLQVTFSKRRSGLFKKASELCTLCGVEMVLVVFSPGRKVFSFGHPSVEEVVDRYVYSARCFLPDPPAVEGDIRGANQLIEARRNANLRDLNVSMTQVLGQLDGERRCAEELNRQRRPGQVQRWWEKPAEDLHSLVQLGQLRKSLANLKRIISMRVDLIMIRASAAVNNSAPAILFNRIPPLPSLFPVAAVGSAPAGMIPLHNLNNNNHMMLKNDGEFGDNNTNTNNPGPVVNHGMLNMPPPPQPQPQPHHNPNVFRTMGYGRGFN